MLVHLQRADVFVALIIIGREIAISALREWMAQIGASKSVAVHMLGKVKTTVQMMAIPFLLYDGTSVWRHRHARLGHLADLDFRRPDGLVDGVLPAKGDSGNPRPGQMSPMRQLEFSVTSSALIRAMPAVFVLIWSTGFIVAKFGLPYAPPLTFLVAALRLVHRVFFDLDPAGRARWPRGRQQWLHLAVTGVLMHAGYLGGVWVAVKGGMGSGLAALIVGLQPVLTALWLSWAGSSGASGDRHRSRRGSGWAGAGLGRPAAGGGPQIRQRQ